MTHPDRYPPDPTPERGHSGEIICAVVLLGAIAALVILAIVAFS